MKALFALLVILAISFQQSFANEELNNFIQLIAQGGFLQDEQCSAACVDLIKQVNTQLYTITGQLANQTALIRTQIDNLNNTINQLNSNLVQYQAQTNANLASATQSVQSINTSVTGQLNKVQSTINANIESLKADLSKEVTTRTMEVNCANTTITNLKTQVANIQKNQCTKVPVYRFWSVIYRDHFYTLDKSGGEKCINKLIYRYEGIAWYACK